MSNCPSDIFQPKADTEIYKGVEKPGRLSVLFLRSRSLRGWDGGKLGFHIIFSAPLGPQGPFLQLDGLGSACGVFTPEGAVLGLHSSPSGHPAGRSRFSLSIRSHRAGPGLPWGLTDRNPTGAGLWGEPGGRGQGPRSALCPT